MAVIVKSEEEIDTILNEISVIYDTEGTKFHGMTYEEGLKNMYEWLVGETDEYPLEP